VKSEIIMSVLIYLSSFILLVVGIWTNDEIAKFANILAAFIILIGEYIKNSILSEIIECKMFLFKYITLLKEIENDKEN